LPIQETLGSIMNRYFSLGKEFRAKISGAINTIAELESRKAAAKQESRKVHRRKEWFESYRWFFTSENFLVIAGRDAKSNEKIVKKHLGPRDYYIHADIYGAPSTILKASENRAPTETSFKEACQFAVSFSRAWSAGMTSGSAYWVLPSQVSKTPESGEFVSTGSWIVRGKRNYIFNLELVLEIEMFDLKGISVPMVHPPFMKDSPAGAKKVTLRPGDMRRDAVAARVAEILNVAKEEIEPLLPPGGSNLIEQP
ncbi:MAG: NFACT RNA binding domain-containing protein, partial [Thermoplasmataceae archaeon]